jgi:hypothetical protein
MILEEVTNAYTNNETESDLSVEREEEPLW